PCNLYKFHRPRLNLKETPHPLKEESQLCLRNLAAYRPPRTKLRFPRSRCAAVLVALFVGRMGDLCVLLSRRSSTLRTYAGDTSLPGGKVDPEDRTIEDTARREAFEEIGLPMDKSKVPLLCTLEPFLAGNAVIVTPVVVLILDNTVRPILNASEVTSLFSHPLLSSEPPFPNDPESIELRYHTFEEYNYHGKPPGRIRMHRFLTGREAGGVKPVFGLTASILIRVSTIGYAQEPEFQVSSPDQPTMEERIVYALRHDANLLEAQRQEGLDPDKVPSPASPRPVSTKPDVRKRRRRVWSRL
ncbi:hypothetical protein JAAARDRAFT_682725, partial [Jaapia argillacea MUCL 33604]